MTIGPLKPFISFGVQERCAAEDCVFDAELTCGSPLSGYLAGKERGGKHVQALEEEWAKTFRVKHAIATNSATSALLAACHALDVGPGKTVVAPTLSMSATTAAPAFLGADISFADSEPNHFCIGKDYGAIPDVLIATNLFGQPCSPGRLSDIVGVRTIEDNAQSPFAISYGRYAGTQADIGCWSLNVHKPLQCGEGGMITTNDDDLAERMRNFINHGEHRSHQIGLNLRMPEICAAIARVQLERGPEIIGGRIRQAEKLIAAIGDTTGIRPPVVREGCTHVYYTVPFLIERKRAEFCDALREQGAPIVEGYTLAHRLPAFKKFARELPVAEDLHDNKLMYIENCAYDLTDEQIGEIGQAFRKAAEMVL